MKDDSAKGEALRGISLLALAPRLVLGYRMDVLREVLGSARGKKTVSWGLSVDIEEPLSYGQH